MVLASLVRRAVSRTVPVDLEDAELGWTRLHGP